MNSPADFCRVILNGELRPAATAGISPLSAGFQYGLGLFETLKVIDGRPVFLRDHHARLRRSAAALGLDYAAPADALRARCAQCAAASGIVAGGLKIVVFQDAARVSELIAPRAADYPPELYARGFRLRTFPDARPAGGLDGLKTLNYLKCLRARRQAQAEGCDEALFVATDGALLEGAASSIFVVRDGVAHTPALAQGILPGIVRARVLGLAGPARAREGIVSAVLLRAAGEVFVTNSLLGVMPVAAVDGQNYDVTRNPVTRSLQAAFQELEQTSVLEA